MADDPNRPFGERTPKEQAKFDKAVEKYKKTDRFKKIEEKAKAHKEGEWRKPSKPQRHPKYQDDKHYEPLKGLKKKAFMDEFDERRMMEAKARVKANLQKKLFSTTGSDQALGALNRRVKAYGLAGTAADMAAAYSMSEGSTSERLYEAGKAGLKGALTGAGMQAAINATGRLGQLASRAFIPAGAVVGAWNIGRAARGAYDWYNADKEADQERAASEAKYGSVERATQTRKMRTDPEYAAAAADRIVNKKPDIDPSLVKDAPYQYRPGLPRTTEF